MAKFAKVGYGSHGQGLGTTVDGYTYVVNDNVRTGDRIQVVSTQHNSGKKFATTAVPLHTYKENTAKGQEAKLEVVAKGDKDIVKALEKKIGQGKFSWEQVNAEEERRGRQITTAYTGKELGIQRSGITPKEYQQQVRGASLAMYKEKNPNVELSKNAQETFDSYSKKFMKGE